MYIYIYYDNNNKNNNKIKEQSLSWSQENIREGQRGNNILQLLYKVDCKERDKGIIWYKAP